MNKKNMYQTDFLTANSFVIGMGSVFNLAGNYFEYNYSRTPEEADEIAIASDWQIIGEDIKQAISGYEKENQTTRFTILNNGS